MTTAFLTLAVLMFVTSTASAHHLEKYSNERRHIRRRAHNVLGAPYRSGGTSPSGFDCSGFTRWAFLEHGANLPHSAQSQFDMAQQFGVVRIWKRSKLKVGDLVFHKTTSAQVGHAGIYIGHGRFISSTSSGGVQIKSLYDPYYWGSRWVGATRLPATMEYKRRDA
jgi:cell wall-associated NlpC family hydrolase